MNNIDQELWTNEAMFNPFGPNLLQLKLNENIRLKLLDLIKDHRATEWEELPIVSGSPTSFDAQKNSIVDGTIGVVSEKWQAEHRPTVGKGMGPGGGILGGIMEDWQEKHHGNIIKNTIQSLLCRYGELYYNMPCESTISDVWYVIMKSGDFHLLHSHRQADIVELSGAIYLEVPDNLPDPQGDITWALGGTRQLLYNPIWGCSPAAGDVFLWPAWLMHMVYPFRSKQERIMISFNGRTDRN